MHSDKLENTHIVICDTGKSFRGGQRQTVNLAHGLVHAGYNITILCDKRSSIENHLENKKINIQDIRYRSFELPLKAMQLATWLKKEGVKIFHASDSHSHSLAVMIRKFYKQLKIAVTVRTHLGRAGKLSDGIKYAGDAINAYIAISRPVADRLLKKGVNERKIEIIPSSIDRSRFNPSDGTQNQILTLGTACELNPEKRVTDIINALELAADEDLDFRFLIAGEGPQKDELEQMIQKKRLSDRIEFAGFVSNMAGFYRKLDVYILASESEGLGSSLLEAGACGAVPVASKSGGPQEIITDGIDGFLFGVGDYKELARIIKCLADNNPPRQKIVKEFEKKLKNFDIDTITKRYIEIYKKILN